MLLERQSQHVERPLDPAILEIVPEARMDERPGIDFLLHIWILDTYLELINPFVEFTNMVASEWPVPASPPGLVHLFSMRAMLSQSLDGGDGPLGRRTLNTVAKGEFSGERLRGEI